MRERGIFYHLGISRLTGWMHKRITARADSEHEQAILRLVLGFIASVYVLSPAHDAIAPLWGSVLQWTAASYMGASVALFVAILVWPGVNPARRYLGMLLDMGTTSFVIAVTGETGTPLMALYLWVTTGNGFRYGLSYLAASAILSILGFGAAYWSSDFWHRHPIFALSVVIALVVIPTYMAALLNKLNQAIVEAREANQAKRQFLANMSHELRTPLGGVIGMVDLLMDSHLSKEQRDLAKTILTSANTLSEIIENILDFSKIEAGRITLESTVFDFHAFFADTTQIFVPQCRNKGLRFNAHIDPRLPYRLEGDSHHTRQILINLIGNAVKFTEQGAIQVRALAIPPGPDDERVWLRMEVEDTGIGIEPQEQARIFESFRQGGASTTRRFGGTGLGTSIARQLTELMGGRVGFSSQPAKGSLFWCELPFARTPSPAGMPELPSRDLNVLVLAEQITYRDLSGYFRDWGLGCELTDSLEAASSAIRFAERVGQRPNVLLIESGFLTLDPLAVVSSLREAVALGKTSLVLLGGPAERLREAELLDAGFSCVLYTPIDKLLLYNAVHAAQATHRMPGNVVSLVGHYREVLGATGQELTILLAEDNETNQQVIRRILERVGHRVVAVNDGESALDRLAQSEGSFDLLILDLNMPRRGGLEVFQAARFLDPNRPVPTIILTAEATQETLDACKRAGVEAFLTKPVHAKTLLEAVAQLNRPRALAESRGRGGREPTLSASQAAPRGHPKKPLVDEQKLQEILSLTSDPEFFRGLMGGFSRDVAKAIEHLGSAVATADYPGMREAVHALQGTSAEMGALRLTDLCLELRRLKPFDMGSAKPAALLGQIREVFDATQVALMEVSQQRRDLST